jgi:hypothetical protein
MASSTEATKYLESRESIKKFVVVLIGIDHEKLIRTRRRHQDEVKNSRR